VRGDPTNLRLRLLNYRLHADLARRAPLNLVLSGPKGAAIHPAKLSHIRLIALAGLAAVPA
jgi:hypothetical protein